MSAREKADLIAAAVRASLAIAAEHGMTIEQFLAQHGDRAIGNNAAQLISDDEVTL